MCTCAASCCEVLVSCDACLQERVYQHQVAELGDMPCMLGQLALCLTRRHYTLHTCVSTQRYTITHTMHMWFRLQHNDIAHAARSLSSPYCLQACTQCSHSGSNTPTFMFLPTALELLIVFACRTHALALVAASNPRQTGKRVLPQTGCACRLSLCCCMGLNLSHAAHSCPLVWTR